MGKITIEMPDTTPIVKLHRALADLGFESKWTGPDSIRCLPRVTPIRERHGVITPMGVVVVPQDDPTPPRAA